MRIRVDDRVHELAEPDPTLERRVPVSMARHEVWQVHPVDQAPVTVNWPAVRVLAVWD